MSPHQEEYIVALIERLTDEIKSASEHSLDQTAHLLRIAKLDLQIRLYRISDEELRHFSEAVERWLSSDVSGGPPN